MMPMDYFRFGPISAVSFLICLLPSAYSMPNPQSTRFFPGAPAVNLNDPSTQIAGLGALGVTAFAASNVFSGNDRIRVRPNLGLNFDPRTQQLSPALTANVQVGDGPVAPTFNVGGQFDPNSGNGIPIAPVVAPQTKIVPF